jgi:hypothetical protein
MPGIVAGAKRGREGECAVTSDHCLSRPADRSSGVNIAPIGHRPSGQRIRSRLAVSRKSALIKPFYVTQPAPLPAEVQPGLSPELRALLALDDPLNDELAHSTIRRSGFLP